MNKRNLYAALAAVFAVTCLFVSSVAAGPMLPTGPAYEWDQNFSDDEGQPSVVWMLNDGTLLCGGNDSSESFLLKYDNVGELIWKKPVAGFENTSIVFIQQADDGGIYLYTASQDLVKVTTDGDVVWSYHLPYGILKSIEIGSDGNIVLAGDYFQSFLLAVDKDGKEAWNLTPSNPIGGGMYNFMSVQNGMNGNYIVVGYIDPVVQTEVYRGFAMEVNSTGGVVWSNQYADPDNSESVLFTTVTKTADGKLAVVSVESKSFGSAIINEDGQFSPGIVMIDPETTKAVSKKAVTFADLIYHIQLASDGGYYMYGSKKNPITNTTDYVIVKSDSKGEPIWVKNLGDNMVRSVQVCLDGGLLISGIDQSSGEVLLIKTKPDTSLSSTKTSPFSVLISLAALGCVCASAYAIRRKD